MKHILFIAAAVPFLLAACTSAGVSSKQGEPVTSGELLSSGTEVVATTQSGKVAGYIDNGVYI